MTPNETQIKAMEPINQLQMALHCAAETAGFATIGEYLSASAVSEEKQRQFCARLVCEMRELGYSIKSGK